jgi:glutathione S-transferase
MRQAGTRAVRRRRDSLAAAGIGAAFEHAVAVVNKNRFTIIRHRRVRCRGGAYRSPGFDRMRLHWSPRSPFVRKVMICAHETGLAERIEKIRSVTSMLSPNFTLMEFNPWSKIPTLITDEGKVLFDSDVICEYLDSLHGQPVLHPVDPRYRWDALRWRAFGNEMLDATILWRNERERPGDRQLARLLAAFQRKLSTALEFLGAEAPLLSAAPFSVGHIAIGCALGYLDLRFSDIDWRSTSPPVDAWYETFRARRSVQLTEPVDDLPRPATAEPKV